MRSVPVALTVAGSDPCGGAGLQADLKTFQALGVYGLSVVTAVTAQDTSRVHTSSAVTPALVTAQLNVVLTDIGADAAKTGMLANAQVVAAVAETLRRHGVKRLVVDPVLLASSGDPLLDAAGMRSLVNDLFPLASIVTPNIDEAAAILGRPLHTMHDLAWAARQLVTLGPRAAVVTGGHLEGPPIDVLFDGERLSTIEGERVDTTSTHGTGCTFSAAIAAYLALGHDIERAVRNAKRFTVAALTAAVPLGHGRGPLGHNLTTAHVR